MNQSLIGTGLKRVGLWVFVALVLAAASLPTPALARYASIVIDAGSGSVLHSANADTRNYPASLTKMMTLYLVFEALQSRRLTLHQRLPVSARAAGMAPSKLGVKGGQSITVETAILALVTKSANDAAVVVAEALGGTEANFARLMTKKAHEIGMQRTTFRNASGLPNRRQLSTARDMATLARRLIYDFPERYRYFSEESYNFQGKEYKNHNALLQSYPGTDGIKTGYIRASGFNLVASAVHNGHRLIGVVFGGRSAKSRDRHMAALLDRGFGRLETLVASNNIRPKPPVLPKVPVPEKPKVAIVATPARPTPPPKPVITQVASIIQRDPNDWSIQVGAYRNIEPARKALHKAIARIPKLTDNTRVSIAPIGAGDSLMYRARLIGLTDATAQAACKRLERRRIPCVAIPPEQLEEGGSPQSQTAAHPR